jgi:hypothetical protein
MIHGSQLAFTETLGIALLATAIWAVYTYFIFRLTQPREALLRCLLLGMALGSLCLLIYQPQYSTHKVGGRALLITQETTAIPDSLPVFALPLMPTPASVQMVPDLAYIERNYPEIGQIYIAGYGLAPEQTKVLRRLQVTYLEKEPPAGFNWLSYTRQIKEGEELVVSGTYRNPSADTLKLLLSTAGGVQDSVILPAGENRFSLQAPARIPGRYTATLQIAPGSHIRKELLPYVVQDRQPLQVLILQGFPSFEMNYLKDWLGQGKHHIRLRARISRDKYATQMINREKQAATKPLLSEESLTAADLLILDAESLLQLSAAERKRVQEAVYQGLGMLVLTDEEWLKKPEVLHHKFSLVSSRELSFAPRQLVQAAHGKVMADKLPAAFSQKSSLIPIAYSRQGEWIAAYTPEGKGRVGAQLAAATFPWLLQGETAAYSQFWTATIEAVSRRQTAEEITLTGFPFILKHYTAGFRLTDTLLVPAAIRYTSGLLQQAMPQQGLPGTMETYYQFLPAEEGWVQIAFGEDTTQYHQIYVLPSNVWEDLRMAGWWRQQEQKKVVDSQGNASIYRHWGEIPALWFFLPLVVSLAVLWWREKR